MKKLVTIKTTNLISSAINKILNKTMKASKLMKASIMKIICRITAQIIMNFNKMKITKIFNKIINNKLTIFHK